MAAQGRARAGAACTTSSIPELGKAIPYGVYDWPATRAGSASASTTTRPLRRRAIRRWWQTMGQPRYPERQRLLITADGGGSNGSRVRLWKMRTAAAGRRTRLGDHGLPLPARHQQVEQDRASPVLLHHPELAGQAAGQLRGHRQPDRRHDHRRRSDGRCNSTPTPIPRASRSPTPKWPPHSHRHDFHGDWNYTITPKAIALEDDSQRALRTGPLDRVGLLCRQQAGHIPRP